MVPEQAASVDVFFKINYALSRTMVDLGHSLIFQPLQVT